MISVVAPVYNEAASLRRLRDELAAAMRDGQVAFEILFIDDGSTDGSWDAIRQLTQEDERVGGIRFRRNYGKAAALQAGFAAARGEIIVTMDADLQDDPRELPRFIDTLNQGFDVVSGWKKVRHDPLDKVLPQISHPIPREQAVGTDHANTPRTELKSTFNKCAVEIRPVVRVCLAEICPEWTTHFSIWRVQNNRIVAAAADINELKTMRRVFREQAPPDSFSGVNSIRIGPHGTQQLFFCSVPSLLVTLTE